MPGSCTEKQTVNQIESKCNERWQPAVSVRLWLEQTDDQSCDKGKKAESRNWFTLLRGNKSVNRESGGAGDNNSPPNVVGGCVS